jgi:hypothetical protein
VRPQLGHLQGNRPSTLRTRSRNPCRDRLLKEELQSLHDGTAFMRISSPIHRLVALVPWHTVESVSLDAGLEKLGLLRHILLVGLIPRLPLLRK